MKKLLTIALLCLSVTAFSQTNDASLNTRIKEYLAYTKTLDFEKVMDYLHPKLFTIAPREAILESFQQSFAGNGMTIAFDSMATISASPVYKFGGADYRRVNYYAKMSITMEKDTVDLSAPETAAIMRQAFVSAFPGKKVVIDKASNSIIVAGTDIMFAIKDATVSDWMFLGYDRSKPELNRQLYPKQVRAFFKLT